MCIALKRNKFPDLAITMCHHADLMYTWAYIKCCYVQQQRV